MGGAQKSRAFGVLALFQSDIGPSINKTAAQTANSAALRTAIKPAASNAALSPFDAADERSLHEFKDIRASPYFRLVIETLRLLADRDPTVVLEGSALGD
jgi:hypothetical protein